MKHVNKTIHLILLLIISSCSLYKPLPFSSLPDGFNITNNINGLYHNDPCLNPFGNYKLWDFIYPKNSVKKEKLYVSLTLNENNILHAKLLDDTTTIAEKYIKIQRKEDSCYYTKRNFYIIPILPVIWWYSDDQKRFIFGENSLILERSNSSGGMFLIMAGGNDLNDSWEYKKK